MPLNQKQHLYLNAMGINRWHRRPSIKGSNLPQINNTSSQSCALDLTVLSHSQLFVDILQSINVDLGDVNLNQNTLNLGWLNWEMCNDEDISLFENTLRTPELSVIAKSQTMKTKLWQLLSQTY